MNTRRVLTVVRVERDLERAQVLGHLRRVDHRRYPQRLSGAVDAVWKGVPERPRIMRGLSSRVPLGRRGLVLALGRDVVDAVALVLEAGEGLPAAVLAL